MWRAFKSAMKSLKAHKSRLILTILELTVGVMAVVIVLSSSQSLKGMITSQLDTFGADAIEIEVKVPNTGHTSLENVSGMVQGVTITSLKHSDAEAIMRELPELTAFYTAIMDQRLVNYQEQAKKTLIFAVDASMIDVDKTEIARGRFFTEEENNGIAKVVVLSPKIEEKLFQGSESIGQFIKIEGENYMVIGVMAPRGAMMGMDYDSIIYMPVKTLQKRVLGTDYVTFMMFKTADMDKVDSTVEGMSLIMRDQHNINDSAMDDFAVISMKEAGEMIDTIFGGITLLLLALVAISLLVGGVGVMNIMYISVSERTFEIGLRKSIGAKKTDILWQFLWEALIITFWGGIIGIIVGVATTFAISYVAAAQGFSDWKFIVPISAYVVGMTFAVGTGLLFGIYPAKKAANMDPIEALRRE